MFRARTWSALLLVSAMVFLMGARQVPLADPQPIAVPAGPKVMYAEKKGQRMIHRNYLNWILNLVNDTNRNLVLVQS
jgi:hypothetical protein